MIFANLFRRLKVLGALPGKCIARQAIRAKLPISSANQ